MENLQPEDECWLELLPIEVISVIASYLKARDVVQCCATSSTLRETFSDDSIWRPRCNKELAENLKETPCKVVPPFVKPQIENSSLSSLPEWRISYMRENHLWNNWRKGKFVKEYIKNINSSADFHMFYNNDCIIGTYRDRIELLDVKGFPASDLVENFCFGTKNSNDLQIEIANDMIVFFMGSGVQVLGLDLNKKKCQLKHTFFFETSLTSTTSGSRKEQSIFQSPTREFKGMRLIVGKFFVGVVRGESTLHIWNLETGQKLKEVACPLSYCLVLEIQASNNMHLVLTVGNAKKETKTFLVYSLANLKFLSFNESQPMNSEYCVYGDFLATMFKNSLQIFNYQTSKTVLTTPTNSLPKAIKNNLLFITNGKIKVFNLVENTTKSIFLDSVLNFEVLGGKFLQIKKNGERNAKVWEFNDTCQHLMETEMNFYFESCAFFLNKACTRYIVREGIGYILNFW